MWVLCFVFFESLLFSFSFSFLFFQNEKKDRYIEWGWGVVWSVDDGWIREEEQWSGLNIHDDY